MTGAGSAKVGVALEDSYGELPAEPDWWQPGIDIEIGDASLDRALSRSRQPNDPRPEGSRPGNREGALSVTFTMTDTKFHDLVFADDGTALASDAMLAPSATWYLGADVIGNTEERFLIGGGVESASWSYQQGEDVTIELTIIYADEADLTTPTDITQPSVDDAVPWHGTDFQIDAVEVSKLQSLTLDIAGMARFRRGQQQEPIDAVVGAYEPSLSVEAILEDSTQRELAYGSSTATEPLDTIDKSPGSLAFDNASGTVADYTLSGLQPTNYGWNSLVSEEDTAESNEYHVTDVAVA